MLIRALIVRLLQRSFPLLTQCRFVGVHGVTPGGRGGNAHLLGRGQRFMAIDLDSQGLTRQYIIVGEGPSGVVWQGLYTLGQTYDIGRWIADSKAIVFDFPG